MVDIQGKKILFIGIGFYDYEKVLKEWLENRGAKVWYFSSVFTSWKKKFCLRLRLPQLAMKWSSENILTLINNAPDEIDQIIIIKGEDFGKEHIAALSNKYPKVKKTLYLWDSLERLPNKDLLLSSFNTILTFDRIDSVKYNLKFRPLFARHLQKQTSDEYKYGISFVGFMHSTRYGIIKKLRKQLEKENISYRFILTTGKFEKWQCLNVTHTVSKDDADILVTEQLPYEKYLDIVRNSNVILDISHPKQSGLTMRTIETLGCGKKLLTTNKDIINYNFNKDQYRILDLEKNIDTEFILNEVQVSSDMEIYSLDQFMEDILMA